MEHIDQIKEVLNRVHYASMATVNEDGSPHNSPLVFLYDQSLKYCYWGSHPNSQHSQNIVRTGQAFFTVFDSIAGSVGVYIQAVDAKVAVGKELPEALQIHNRFREKANKKALDISYYQGTNPQRMWRAKTETVWINAYERDEKGRLLSDYKIQIDLETLDGLWN